MFIHPYLAEEHIRQHEQELRTSALQYTPHRSRPRTGRRGQTAPGALKWGRPDMYRSPNRSTAKGTPCLFLVRFLLGPGAFFGCDVVLMR